MTRRLGASRPGCLQAGVHPRLPRPPGAVGHAGDQSSLVRRGRQRLELVGVHSVQGAHLPHARRRRAVHHQLGHEVGAGRLPDGQEGHGTEHGAHGRRRCASVSMRPRVGGSSRRRAARPGLPCSRRAAAPILAATWPDDRSSPTSWSPSPQAPGSWARAAEATRTTPPEPAPSLAERPLGLLDGSGGPGRRRARLPWYPRWGRRWSERSA